MPDAALAVDEGQDLDAAGFSGTFDRAVAAFARDGAIDVERASNTISALRSAVSTSASGRGTSPEKVPSVSVSIGGTTISAPSTRRKAGASARSFACMVARPIRWLA